MSEVDWINIAGRSLLYCADLLQMIKSLKELLENVQEELKRVKDLLKEKQDREGYDTVY